MEELKPCPKCGGEIRLMCGLLRDVTIYAHCKECNTEYDLPEVKLKTWKSNPTKISKETIHKAEKTWNKMGGVKNEPLA